MIDQISQSIEDGFRTQVLHAFCGAESASALLAGLACELWLRRDQDDIAATDWTGPMRGRGSEKAD